MKKRIAFILALAFLLCALMMGTAQAQSAVSGLDIAIGPEDKLWALDGDEPLMDKAVSAIYAAGESYVLYGVEAGEMGEELYALSLLGDEVIVESIGNASAALWCPQEQELHFADSQQPNTLYSYNPMEASIEKMIAAEDQIMGLRMSADGLLVSLPAEELLYLPAAKILAQPLVNHQDYLVNVGEGYETLLDVEGNLYMRFAQEEEIALIDSSVILSQAEGDMVYYLSQMEKGAVLMAYNMSTNEFSQLCFIQEDVLPLMLVDENVIYLADENRVAYAYQLLTGQLDVVGLMPQTQAIPALVARDGALLIYDLSAPLGQRYKATLTYQGAVQEDVWEEAVPTPVPAPQATPEPAPEPTATPAPTSPYRTLSRGATGEDVRKMQEGLRKYGYLTGSADGIFGGQTETALLYLQFDISEEETGSASVSLQKKIIRGDIPDYEPYVYLATGDSGIRVKDLQNRLRELHYMSVNAGGNYKTGTTAAVKRFQEQMGYSVTGNITAKQMRALFKENCAKCKEYYELNKGESAPVIKKLNQRLKKLGYFTGTAGESYGKKTQQAIELFQQFNGLKVSGGKCTAELQEMIYDSSAKPYKPEPTPVPDWTAPTEKQIRVMRNWLKDEFGGKWGNKKVFNKIQEQLSELGFLKAGYQSGQYDKTTWTAVKDFQASESGLTASGIADKATMNALFK